MMMHTPGPWTVESRTLAVYAPDRHGHAAAVRVAECGRTLLPTAEIAANAALVAAAPDLLAALNSMIDLAEFWINHRQERHMSEEQYRVWIALGHESNAMIKARVAIARATGGQ